MDNASVEGSDGQDKTASSSSSSDDQENSELVWAFEKLKDNDPVLLSNYIRFAATACIPGGGCDIEQALDVLYKCQGDIMHATNQLLSREANYQTLWTLNERQKFEQAFSKYPKNFCLISKELTTKSVKDCVRYYYLWKKSIYRNNPSATLKLEPHNSISPETNNNNNNNNTAQNCKLEYTYQGATSTNHTNQTCQLQHQQQQNQLYTQSILVPLTPTSTNQSTFQMLGATQPTSTINSPPLACGLESIATPSSSASDESRDSGRGETSLDDSSCTSHPTRHVVYYTPQYPIAQHDQVHQQQQQQHQYPTRKELDQAKQPQAEEIFPCKVCGREFAKIKSRSAHMKRHKNEKLYG